jgi:vacuolar-type H+-ATPase subunit E/Vma4
MGIEDILKRIIEDFQNKREEILNEAAEERRRIIEEAEKKAEDIYEEIILKAEKEANFEAERLIILERLESQKEILSFKRRILDEVFKKAEERFPIKKIRKKVITPNKELEIEEDLSWYLKELQPKLEITVNKILWPG